ncbi:hypothetical protein N7495_007535 [Penicillium taxi]|uniref:uncharacterized protein n=1 Tax=Penicillium taxi TaxID=168475 RepID=UPI002545B50E|nr:uncharacterized protein N7495_007535 [Penicillium taxi]KAJ5887494.1 hypothetical protein N7495_007535 [Penicillium taxi]
MSVSASSIPDTSLGLTSSEIQILRQQQQIALQNTHANNGAARGRGTGYTSNSSSRATSAASSHGRLLLDPESLSALSHQLGHLERRISGQIDYLSQQITDSVKRSRSGVLKTIEAVEAEMDRTRSMMASADELDNELAKIGHIRDIVKSFRGRIESLDRRMDQSRRRR